MSAMIKVLLSSSSGAPWAITIGVILICVVVYYIQTIRSKKLDKEADMFRSYLERQTQLDSSQRLLIEELRAETLDFKAELLEVRKQLSKEHEHSLELKEQIQDLSVENKKLKILVKELQTLVENLTLENEKLRHENKQEKTL